MLRPYTIPTVPTHSLFFGGLEVGVCARGVIGDVDDPADRGHKLREHAFDALPQGDVGHAASLASAAHPEHHDGILHVDQLDAPAVARDHRVHLFFEDFRDLLVERVVVDRAGRLRSGGHGRHRARYGRANRAANRLAHSLPGYGRLFDHGHDIARNDQLGYVETWQGENR